MRVVNFLKKEALSFFVYGGVEGKVIGAFMVVALSIALGLSLWFGFYLLNQVAVREMANEQKAVAEKKFFPAHHGIMPMVVGKVTMMLPSNTPERYQLCFQFGDEVGCGNVPQEVHRSAEVGQRFSVSYGIGRLDGRIVVHSIRPAS